MNRKNLTAAVLAGLAGAAGIAGTAQAVNLNPDGLGQVLIYPYYTSNDGNNTLLSVVNTTSKGKAVKVRFKEGYNSREVLDFNMYMSAYDVWVAAIVDLEGTPNLIIPDTTCTVPYLYDIAFDATYGGGVQPFLPYDYTGLNSDGGPSGIGRAAEGYFEMIEMGTLNNDDARPASPGVPARIGADKAATHIVKDGKQVPANCAQLVNNWYDLEQEGGVNKANGTGHWFESVEGVGRNSGGLFGGAAIINVGKGTMHSYDAKAIQGFDSSDDGDHHTPGLSVPSLNTGNETTAFVFYGVPQNRVAEFSYASSRGGDPSGVDAVSATLMHEFTINEFNIEAGNNAASEWIVTFPTKSWYVDPAIVGSFLTWIPDQNDPGCGFQPGDEFPPRSGPDFSDRITGSYNGQDYDEEDHESWGTCTYIEYGIDGDPIPPFTSLFDGEACEQFGLKLVDREEDAFTPGGGNGAPVVSPRPPGPPSPTNPVFHLCYEVNVMRFGEESVFGTTSDLLYTVNTAGRESGWGWLNWGIKYPANHPTKAGKHIHQDYAGLVGLPVTGFWALQYTNGFLGAGSSVLANYGGAFDHKGNTRRARVCLGRDEVCD